MRIMIDNHSIECHTTQRTKCAGTLQFYDISYMLDGECVYTISTKALDSQPSPIAALRWTEEWWLPCDDPTMPGYFTVNAGEGRRRLKQTHLQWLLAALDQIDFEHHVTN